MLLPLRVTKANLLIAAPPPPPSPKQQFIRLQLFRHHAAKLCSGVPFFRAKSGSGRRAPKRLTSRFPQPAASLFALEKLNALSKVTKPQALWICNISRKKMSEPTNLISLSRVNNLLFFTRVNYLLFSNELISFLINSLHFSHLNLRLYEYPIPFSLLPSWYANIKEHDALPISTAVSF